MGEIRIYKSDRWIILYDKWLKTDMDILKTLAHEIGHHHISKTNPTKKISLHEAGAQIWAIKRAYELNDISLVNKLLYDEKQWRTRKGNDKYKRASKICRPLLTSFNKSEYSDSIIPRKKDVSILEKFLKDHFPFYHSSEDIMKGKNNVTP